MPYDQIDQLDDPRLDCYRDLKRRREAEFRGLFIAEGHRVVQRLFESRYPVHSVLVTPRRRHLIEQTVPPSVPFYEVPEELAEQLIGYQFHGGVMACGVRQPSPAIESLLNCDSDSRELIVICPRITDPDNLGGLIRIARGFGVRLLILGEECVDAFSRRVIRVSMGNALHLPILRVANLPEVMQQLKTEYRIRLHATVLDSQATSLAEVATSERSGLVFGNEADGLDARSIELCDCQITIPMDSGTDSLNVTVAAGIFLYHFARCHQ